MSTLPALLVLAIASHVAPPEHSLVKLTSDDPGHAHQAIVLTSGDLLTVVGKRTQDANWTHAVTEDGHEHEVVGVAAAMWSHPLILLRVDWEGEPPPGLDVRNVDQLEDENVTMVAAGQEPSTGKVSQHGEIRSDVGIMPDQFLMPKEWAGCAVIDGDGRLLGVVTAVSAGSSLTVPPRPFQMFHCIPGAWMKTLYASRFERPLSWAEWADERHRRQALRDRRESAVAIQFDHPGESETELKRVVRESPNFADAWFALGRLQARSGRHEDARNAAKRALELDPGHHGAAILLTSSSLRTGHVQEARETMQRAIRMHHDKLHDHYLDAYYLFYTGYPEQALEEVDRVLLGLPEDEDALQLREEIIEWLNREP